MNNIGNICIKYMRKREARYMENISFSKKIEKNVKSTLNPRYKSNP